MNPIDTNLLDPKSVLVHEEEYMHMCIIIFVLISDESVKHSRSLKDISWIIWSCHDMQIASLKDAFRRTCMNNSNLLKVICLAF